MIGHETQTRMDQCRVEQGPRVQPPAAHDTHKHTHLKLSLILKLTLQSHSYPQLNLKL